MDGNLLLIILLVFFTAAFSGAEIAFTSLSPAKVRTFQSDRRFASKAIFRLKTHSERLLIAILLCNNLGTILIGVIATIWGIKTFGSATVGVITGLLSLILLIVGEIIPKIFAQKYSEGFSRIIAYPMLWITYILFPVLWLIEKFVHGIIKACKIKSSMQSVSEEELLALVDIGTKEGVIGEHEQDLIENVLKFTDTTVEEIMTLEKNIQALGCKSTLQDAARFFVDNSFSRVPVYDGNIDNIIGILNVHEVLRLTMQPSNIKTLNEVQFTPVITVPKTESINQLFKKFQRRKQHMAAVVDEYGNTVGLVTLEDILEEIVGDIVDEQDREFKKIYKIEKNVWEAFGECTIEEINLALKIELGYPKHQPISLLILEQLHRFPKQGEKILFENIIIEVKLMSKKKIERVIIERIPEPN
ncbi:MAG: hemolysin family protein [Gammaproteobacteria bacterium]|nr:hemolysin family protein [Gammaproteobacteria bacterium]